MDCSGFIYYTLKEAGFGDVPRQSNEQYIWVRKKSVIPEGLKKRRYVYFVVRLNQTRAFALESYGAASPCSSMSIAHCPSCGMCEYASTRVSTR